MLQAEVHRVRQASRFPASRFHFSQVTKKQRHVYRALAQATHQVENLQFRGLYVDKQVADPAQLSSGEEWRVKANLVAILLTQFIRSDEQVTVLIDRMPPPPRGTFEQVVLGRLRGRVGRQPVTSMLQLDSRTCDGLQIADLMTSAMMHELRQLHMSASKTNAKAALVDDIRKIWNVGSLADANTRRLHVSRYRLPSGSAQQGDLLE